MLQTTVSSQKNINVHCTRDVKASLMKNKYHILATNPNAKKNHLTIRAKYSIAQRTLFVFCFVR